MDSQSDADTATAKPRTTTSTPSKTTDTAEDRDYVRLPLLWAENLLIWFRQAEAQFCLFALDKVYTIPSS